MRLKHSTDHADNGLDATTLIRILLEDHALAQIISSDRPTDLKYLVLRCGETDFSFDVVIFAFGVADELPHQVRKYRPVRA